MIEGSGHLQHPRKVENVAPSTFTKYTGIGLISDGGSEGAVSAFVTFEDNDVVHAAGFGVMIASGHDISATGNRVVSCGA
jgi:hypothetical protein